MDLICGQYNGKVRAFYNVGTPSDPILTSLGNIMAGGSGIDIGSYSVPYMDDWNEDGRPDLLIGSHDGRIWLYINDGTPNAPHFTSAAYVQENGSTMDVGDRAAPCVADLDGDGLRDLIVGEIYGKVRFYRNQGSPGNPLFSGYEVLRTSGTDIAAISSARPDAVDWDNDGDVDLVLGQYLGVPILHENDAFQVDIPSLSLQYNWASVPPGGGTISYELTLNNGAAQPVTFDLYTIIQGYPYGFRAPVRAFPGLTMAAGQSAKKTLYQKIPGYLPSGYYYYSVYIGDAQNMEFLNRGYFSFYKQ